MNKGLLLFGGGIDSAALGMYLFKHDVAFDCLLFNYQHKSYNGERHAAMHFTNVWGNKLHEQSINLWSVMNHPMLIDGIMTNEHNENVLPLRNQAFLTSATIHALALGYDTLYIGYHIEPSNSKFHDARIEFGLGFQALLDMQGVNVKIEMPFATLNKEEYIYHLNTYHLLKTFSCYESQTTEECGICTHCQQKKQYIQQSLNAD